MLLLNFINEGQVTNHRLIYEFCQCKLKILGWNWMIYEMLCLLKLEFNTISCRPFPIEGSTLDEEVYSGLSDYIE